MATREMGPGGRPRQEILAPYKRPDARNAGLQILSSVIPFGVIWWLMLLNLDWTGRALGVLTLTPYEYWQRNHAMHYATHDDLDRREQGDLTVREPQAQTRREKLAYRLYRNVFVMLVTG